MEPLNSIECTRSQPLLNAVFHLSNGLIKEGNINNLTEFEVRIDNIHEYTLKIQTCIMCQEVIFFN